ncbi:hypothetical protein GE21DRAFT_5286 [Neurospora crassa]|uniref:Integral membrane protein n=2 Tax=Neurospora TaxID=5140 RepID=Q7SAS6_NEUCR|nr:uncharacterized protein NEUTE1DRAFT_77999 [Neurospora tetrasperma FGSC 2508]XP_962732.1 integral membrane protein [Neurospora crassa OR74A]EGZ72705.1 hypothetical protein NEUTE2DRAFT_106553 [Neurospora tetrasperma FGSC 2509]KHE78673.1 hypothetical protein GE21DRAFT_5286 [Neurospora crassa]EAA33496.1 integral membrane protein [Neurospora crassa OR74A]EGO58627.1 hypothetical protein NEUTE1DRAFT_77999 [Neurospora tetrasperma FGSC 2508]|eukprot:XP_962732.1 integral membrane protein [Neurospora crassa OR74A]
MTVPVKGRGPQVAGAAGLFVALSTVAVLLRCYCRVIIVKQFGLDDWLTFISWFFFVFYCTFSIAGTHHGTGQHAVDLPPNELPIGLKWWWACEPVYVLAGLALKASIGVQLLRIAVSKTHKLIIWITVGTLEIVGVAYFLVFVMQCMPSEYFWTRFTGGTGSCMNPQIVVDATYAYSAITCATDWILGLLPISLVWHLQMNSRTKLMVAGILSIGAVASTATIVRIPYVKDLGNQADFLWATSDVAIWSTAETGIGLVASSLATLRPLLRLFLTKSQLGESTSGGLGTQQFGATTNANGYIRSRTPKNGAEEFGLRNDIGKGRGVTTVVEAGGSDGTKRSMSGSRESVGPLTAANNWNTSETKLTDMSSDDGHGSGGHGGSSGWPTGTKTTTVTHVVES